jgi:hypothetical protein
MLARVRSKTEPFFLRRCYHLLLIDLVWSILVGEPGAEHMPGEASVDSTCSTSAPVLIKHKVEYGKAASISVQTWATKDFYHATRSTVCGDADYTGLKGM